MTYNIQQGYDLEGNKNLAGQLAILRTVDPDILGLQESDTARVANGNVDAVRYFADKLDMYSYYGPATTTGTFGIALLSKYPIRNPTTFFMVSAGEQTATIHAEIDKNGKAYHIFVTHLGNDGPLVQVEDVLTRIGSLNNVIVMGDFNLRPSTDQYTLLTQTLDDSWLLKWPGGKDAAEFSSKDRIDYIFVSPGVRVFESEYKVNPASDHPYLYTVIKP
jgi:endonuclease/exonuclease/phosphatase family metal-dependent hydrolase